MKDANSEITFCLICKNKFKLNKIIDLSDEEEVNNLLAPTNLYFKA